MKNLTITLFCIALLGQASAFAAGPVEARLVDQDGVARGLTFVDGKVSSDTSSSTNMEVRLVNSNGNDIEVDPSTRTLVTTDGYPHSELHKGNHYMCSSRTTLGDGDAHLVLITTPDTTKWTHMEFFFSGSLDTDYDIYEGATNTAGAVITTFNNNRNSTNLSALVFNSTTGATNGLHIFTGGFGIDTGGGANKVAAGGAERGDSEIILKQNTVYMICIISHSVDNKVGTTQEWYEHTDKTD